MARPETPKVIIVLYANKMFTLRYFIFQIALLDHCLHLMVTVTWFLIVANLDM